MLKPEIQSVLERFFAPEVNIPVVLLSRADTLRKRRDKVYNILNLMNREKNQLKTVQALVILKGLDEQIQQVIFPKSFTC